MSAARKDSLPGDEGEVEDLEKLQAEIARMEAEAARIAQETEDSEKEKPSLNMMASASDSGVGKGKSVNGLVGEANEKAKKDG